MATGSNSDTLSTAHVSERANGIDQGTQPLMWLEAELAPDQCEVVIILGVDGDAQIKTSGANGAFDRGQIGTGAASLPSGNHRLMGAKPVAELLLGQASPFPCFRD